MRITGVPTAGANAKYDWTFIRIYTDEDVTGLAQRFTAQLLPQGEIYHGC